MDHTPDLVYPAPPIYTYVSRELYCQESCIWLGSWTGVGSFPCTTHATLHFNSSYTYPVTDPKASNKKKKTGSQLATTQSGTCCTTGIIQIGEALENGDISRVSRNEEFLELLRGLSSDKIDFATAHLLSHWDSLSGGDEVRFLCHQGTRR